MQLNKHPVATPACSKDRGGLTQYHVNVYLGINKTYLYFSNLPGRFTVVIEESFTSTFLS